MIPDDLPVLYLMKFYQVLYPAISGMRQVFVRYLTVPNDLPVLYLMKFYQVLYPAISGMRQVFVRYRMIPVVVPVLYLTLPVKAGRTCTFRTGPSGLLSRELFSRGPVDRLVSSGGIPPKGVACNLPVVTCAS